MNKLPTLIKKNFKLLIRSRFSALIILVGPLLIMLLTGLAFNNTNAYNINIGVFAEEYTELTESFIEKLRSEQFFIFNTVSEKSCEDRLKEGKFHICIIFPKNLSMGGESPKEITFYVDYSKINLVWMIIDTISTKISERSSELSLNLTTSIIDILKKTESELLDKEISVFSFHNPDMGSALSIEDYRLSGMINAYAKKFKQSYHYISDSNGYWRYLRLYDLLKKADKKRIQILIHPGWWQKTAMSPRKRVIRCIEERRKRTLETYDAILKKSKRKNIY